MATTKKYLVIGDLRGGRNGSDAPLSLPDTQCVEALNVDWYRATLGSKRNGASSVSLAPSIAGIAFTGYLSSLFYASYGYTDYPFAVDSAKIVNFYEGSYPGWTRVFNGDAISANPEAVNAVTFNNRTYVCYNSGVDRLHYWTREWSATDTFYRVGIPVPVAAPTVTNYGSGSYAATLRYYKVAFVDISGSDTLNRSELSPLVSFTPSGSGSAARVARPTGHAGEHYTHWELYGSSDGNLYRLLDTIEILTTTYDDTTAPGSYDGEFAPVVGANTPPGSWKYIATNGNRLLGVGNWVGGQQSRVWYTPVYGASDIGDAERIPTSNFIDLDAYDGDTATGIVGSFMGNSIVFKQRQIWRLVPTGDDVTPYSAICLTKAIGCVAPKSIAIGEDENGSPSLYFMSHRGPYRLGSSGLEYCGRDIEDLTATMNQTATVPCHATWHPSRHQMWFWVALNSDSYPSERLVMDTQLARRGAEGVRGGWSRHTGVSCTARCSMSFGPTMTSGARLDTLPYAGSSATVNLLLKCDDDTVTRDNTTPFQAYIKTKPYPLGGLGFNCSVKQSHLTAKAGEGVTITQTIDRDYGAEVRESTCPLTSTGDETRVQRQFEGSDMQGAGVVQFQVGDDQALSQTWTLDALVVPYSQHEER